MKKFMSEFKEFISKGDVMSMAVGIIIGGKMVCCDTLAAVKDGISLEDRFFRLYDERMGGEQA